MKTYIFIFIIIYQICLNSCKDEYMITKVVTQRAALGRVSAVYAVLVLGGSHAFVAIQYNSTTGCIFPA